MASKRLTTSSDFQIAAFVSAASFAVAHIVQGWKSVLVVFGFALVFQSTDLGIKNLAASHYAAIPLMYVIDLLPLALGFGMLLFGGIRFGFWRPAAAVAEPA